MHYEEYSLKIARALLFKIVLKIVKNIIKVKGIKDLCKICIFEVLTELLVLYSWYSAPRLNLISIYMFHYCCKHYCFSAPPPCFFYISMAGGGAYAYSIYYFHSISYSTAYFSLWPLHFTLSSCWPQ